MVDRIGPDDLDDSIEAMLAPLDALELTALESDETRAEGVLPDLLGMTKRQVRAELRRLGVGWDPRGAGWVVRQSPPPGTALSQVALCSIEFAGKARDEDHES